MIFYIDTNGNKPICVKYNDCLYFSSINWCVRNRPECAKAIVKNKRSIYNRFSLDIARLRLSSKPRYRVVKSKMLAEHGLEHGYCRI